MYVSYGGRTLKWTKGTAYYGCVFERGHGSYQVCQRLSGRQIDKVVVDAFLSVIEPAAIQVAILAERRLRQDNQEVQQLWRLQIEKSQYEAERARRQYDAVEPENRVVARELERRWAVDVSSSDCARQVQMSTKPPLGALLGGYGAAGVARRVGREILGRVVIAIGFTVSAVFFARLL
jgi:hypothetical protein